MFAIACAILAWAFMGYDAYASVQRYSCDRVGRPKNIEWSELSWKKDVPGVLKLHFDDSENAHRVDILYRRNNEPWVLIENEHDDSWYTFQAMQGGRYEVRMRGSSKCGKSDWSVPAIKNPNWEIPEPLVCSVREVSEWGLSKKVQTYP